MKSLLVSFVALIIGYCTYGKLIEKVFCPDNRATPAIAINDGVDCIPMKTWKAFLIQLLNIAGTGPIFGALMGAVYGPVVYLWIVFGSVLGGAVHDYLSGMISCRNDGLSVAELSGSYLGSKVRYIVRFVMLLLMIMAGTVMVTSPAALLALLTPDFLNQNFWVAVILIYCILATILPIDKIIGKIYPVFGMLLVTMALGILWGIVNYKGGSMPEMTLQNLHPNNLPVWPFMFVTVACGAISGFHATQSPMISKCIKSEKEGRKVFFLAMLIEAAIALIWASAGVAFYESSSALNDAISTLGQSGVVYEISKRCFGSVGCILAIAGVIACSVSTGDTVFRAARLILAEAFKFPQKKIKNRLIVTIPLGILCGFFTQFDFNILWRYMAWLNQTLSVFSLWVITAYLMKHAKNKMYSLISAIPAVFMSAVSMTYILAAPEGFSLSAKLAYPVGTTFAVSLFILYMFKLKTKDSDI